MMRSVVPCRNRSIAKAEGRFELSRFEPRLKAVQTAMQWFLRSSLQMTPAGDTGAAC